jgi:hypothetical protein
MPETIEAGARVYYNSGSNRATGTVVRVYKHTTRVRWDEGGHETSEPSEDISLVWWDEDEDGGVCDDCGCRTDRLVEAEGLRYVKRCEDCDSQAETTRLLREEGRYN